MFTRQSYALTALHHRENTLLSLTTASDNTSKITLTLSCLPSVLSLRLASDSTAELSAAVFSYKSIN